MAAPATAAAGASAASLPADTTASRRRRSVLLQNIPGSAEEAEAESHHKHPGDVAAKREDQVSSGPAIIVTVVGRGAGTGATRLTCLVGLPSSDCPLSHQHPLSCLLAHH